MEETSASPPRVASPTGAMRARAERNLQRARALRAARARGSAPAPPADTGGGFLPEPEDESAAPRRAAPPAPRLDPGERPPCLDCGRAIALSYLLDAFGHPVCDECRDADGAHALVTRTEAKAEFLLRDCDLDARGGPLRCERRRNPHSTRGDMRLYLRLQVEERAELAWGGAAGLAAERARRAAAGAERDARRTARRLRALRQEARSSLFAGARAREPHRHELGAETYDADADAYSRACACGHVETYEKM